MDRHQKWTSLLESESTEQQVEALRQISKSEAVGGLSATVVRLAGSRRDEVRMWAAEALESAIAPAASEAPSLSDLLTSGPGGCDPDGEVCYWAATLLGRLGNQAASAVPALESVLRESHYLPAREQATWALCQIGPPALAAAEVLKEVSDDAPPRLQRMASEALRAIGEAA